MDKNIQKALLPSHGREKEAFNPLQIQVTADSKTPDLCVQALFANLAQGVHTCQS